MSEVPTSVEESKGTRCELFGDKTNGVEYCWQGDDLDEIFLYINGECVFHMERMCERTYWLGLYPPGYNGHAFVGLNGRRVAFSQAEAWKDEPALPPTP
jgi:hypothetical protein